MNFFHRLFNPHCEHCFRERQEAKHCSTCEVLLMDNEKLRYQNEQLLNRLLNTKVEETTAPVKNEVTEVKTSASHIPWRVRQQLLETEDRKKAQLMREAAKPNTDKLEREVLG